MTKNISNSSGARRKRDSSWILNAKIEHVNGPTAYGISLQTTTSIRFQRIKRVAGMAAEKASTHPDLDQLENQLNDNYKGEGLRLTITENEVVVDDILGAQTVII